jgi:hypothetical protein
MKVQSGASAKEQLFRIGHVQVNMFCTMSNMRIYASQQTGSRSMRLDERVGCGIPRPSGDHWVT